MITKYERGRPGSATTPVQDDVVGPGLQSENDIVFDVIGRQLEADRDAARAFPDFVREFAEIVRRVRVREGRGGDRRGNFA